MHVTKEYHGSESHSSHKSSSRTKDVTRYVCAPNSLKWVYCRFIVGSKKTGTSATCTNRTSSLLHRYALAVSDTYTTKYLR